MAKTKISEYSATANSNTDIGGINVDEGCAPSGINDAIRTLMAQLKNFQTGTGGDSFNGPIGTTTPAAGAFTTLSATGVATFSAGSASAPALTTSGDTNTGIAFPAADTVAVATGGTERVRVDSSGNVGVGVTPSAWSIGKNIDFGPTGAIDSDGYTRLLDNVYYNAAWKTKVTGQSSYYQMGVGVHSWYTAGSVTAGSTPTFTQAMTLDASGNLGIGATTVNGMVHLRRDTSSGSSTSYPNIRLDNPNASGYTGYYFYADATQKAGFELNNSNGALTTIVAGAERARIDSSGNLLVGTTTQTGTFNVTYTGTSQPVSYCYASNASFTNAVVRASMAGTSSSAQIFLGQNNNTTAVFYVQGNGTINSTSTSITGISDIRFKENIRDLDDGLDVVMALKPRKFDWKEGKGADIKNARGFIAQEFEEVLPDLIGEWLEEAPEGEAPYKSVRPDLIPTLVKAIQEQQAIIESLTQRISALES